MQQKLPIVDRVEVLENIHQRQLKLGDKIEYRNNGLSVNTKSPTKQLSKGCQTCKDGTWWCLYVGHKCNLDCWYCPQGTKEDKDKLVDHNHAMQQHWIDDIKTTLRVIKPGTIKGVSYSGGEPFMFLNKIKNVATFIQENFSDIYQWMYTNGVLVTEDALKEIRDLGIQELRFHIGSTNFNSDVINMMEKATKIIDNVVIETPANLSLKEHLIDKENLIKYKDMGIKQLNLAEMFFTHPRQYPKTRLYNYTSMFRGSHISPISSRIVTYDVIDFAVQKNIDIIINDCSHESRDAQLITRTLNKDRLPNMH